MEIKIMIQKPSVNANKEQIEAFIRSWVKYACNEGFSAALQLIDTNTKILWSDELFDELTFDHYEDGQHCRITDPSEVKNLRVGVYPYNDGSGFAVDHDLPLNGKLSDFTAQFDIRRTGEQLTVILSDIHIL